MQDLFNKRNHFERCAIEYFTLMNGKDVYLTRSVINVLMHTAIINQKRYEFQLIEMQLKMHLIYIHTEKHFLTCLKKLVGLKNFVKGIDEPRIFNSNSPRTIWYIIEHVNNFLLENNAFNTDQTETVSTLLISIVNRLNESVSVYNTIMDVT